MSKHTPGPWNAHKYTRIGGGYGFAIQAGASHGISIAGISPGTTTDRVEAVAEANARLIAAAPEMLSRLIDTQELLSALMEYTSGDAKALSLLQTQFASNRAIIAKIEGEQ